jgi:tetratricopeptide (TPR) repeat protein
MTDRPPPTNTGFLFDDEPLESILYDDTGAGAGPSPAGLFTSAEPFVSAIFQAFERGDMEEGLHGMAELLARGDPVRVSNLIRFAVLMGSFIPSVPCPIVQDRNVSYGSLLDHLLAAGLAWDDDTLVQRAGTLLYRYYEGCGRYGDAASVVGHLLERVKKRGDRSNEAVLTNNLGYDYLLACDWDRAEGCFARAITLFADDHSGFERANARLNHLVARYERAGGAPSERFEKKLYRFMAALGKDWRQRKALIPLARIAERRGKLEIAIRYARQAVAACEGIPTKHRIEDQEYLERLEEKRKVGP